MTGVLGFLDTHYIITVIIPVYYLLQFSVPSCASVPEETRNVTISILSKRTSTRSGCLR